MFENIPSVTRLWPAARVAWLLRGVHRGRVSGAQLSRALERFGPAYIKLGQMLATRPDIVGEEVAQGLENLQDRLPPFADAEARQVIAKSFARPVEDLFAVFGPPIAPASIAQVHRAQSTEGA